MTNTFNGIFEGKRVLVTGHTGFKGSWLSIWLDLLGADVIGFSLPEPPTEISNFELSNLKDRVEDVRGDVRDLETVKRVIAKYEPEIIFHLAAQPIVLRAYENPVETFTTNAIGTVNMLDSAKNSESVKVFVSITTDKVYLNKNWPWGYRENDELGDVDPYGASKAMAELAIKCYRESYLRTGKGDNDIKLAATRAGNVIGGGDFAKHRLIPDCIRAFINNEKVELRNPAHVRPWQLVLEPLSGYLALAAKMWQSDGDEFSEAWNFGPLNTHSVTVGEVIELMIEQWGKGGWKNVGKKNPNREASLLMLDCSKAYQKLAWGPVYNTGETISEVVDWYKEYENQLSSETKEGMYNTCVAQIKKYSERAKELGIEWAS